MRLSTLVLAATLATGLTAQEPDCNGSGGFTLEIEATSQDAVIGPGSEILVRLRGTPFAHFCLICDDEEGIVDVAPIGQICSAFTADAILIAGNLPADGVLEAVGTLPNDPALANTLLCCVGIQLDFDDTGVVIDHTNRVCICQGFECEDVGELQLSTTLPTPAGPVTITATAREDDDGGDLMGQASVVYDPASPPSLPITSDDMTIENISSVEDGLVVLFRVGSESTGGKFKANTYFSVEDGSNANEEEIHTSCSQALGIGFVFDEFTITDLVDPTKDDVCRGKADLQSLELLYTGDDCSALNHIQDPDKVQCIDFGAIPSPAFIRASDEEDGDGSGTIYFEGTVTIGSSFDIVAPTDGGGKKGKGGFRAETFVHVFDAQGGTLLQLIEFHTSCSQPLRIGDQFGSVRINGFTLDAD